MKRILVVLFLVLILTLPAAGGSGRIGAMLVHLSGDQEVGPVSNSFIGRLFIAFEDDLSAADLNLTLYVPNVTGAHLHCAAAGTNGTIVVGLQEGGLFFPPEHALGRIGKVMITNDDILPRTAAGWRSTTSHLSWPRYGWASSTSMFTRPRFPVALSGLSFGDICFPKDFHPGGVLYCVPWNDPGRDALNVYLLGKAARA